jgi:hypothetical protein
MVHAVRLQVIVRTRSEPGNCPEPEANGNQILGNGDDNVTHVQGANQSGARVIAAIGAYENANDGANDAEQQ